MFRSHPNGFCGMRSRGDCGRVSQEETAVEYASAAFHCLRVAFVLCRSGYVSATCALAVRQSGGAFRRTPLRLTPSRLTTNRLCSKQEAGLSEVYCKKAETRLFQIGQNGCFELGEVGGAGPGLTNNAVAVDHERGGAGLFDAVVGPGPAGIFRQVAADGF